MSKTFFILAAAILVYLFYPRSFHPYPVSETLKKGIFSLKGEPSGPEGCWGKEKCLLVYVAPWCGACHQFKNEILPTFQEVLKYSYPQWGLAFLVGQDSPEKVRRMGQELGTPYLSDQSGEFYQELKVRGVPSFFALDSKGKVEGVETGFMVRGETLEEACHFFIRKIFAWGGDRLK